MPQSVNQLSLQVGALARKLRRRVRLLLGGESPRHYFDLRDRDLIDQLLAAGSLPPLAASPHETAVRDGDAARGDKVYELRDDVRREIPLALTPAQRGTYLHWFLVLGGRHETDATLADLLRSLLELDAMPDRGLVASYLVQPKWQEKHPQALTPAGWEPFKRWLATEYGIRGRWLRRARLPAKYAAMLARSGVNVIGLFRYVSGLQQAAESVVNALSELGIATELRDVPMAHNRDGRPRTGFDGLERFPITILNTGLDIPVPEAYRLAGLFRRPDVYRIAVWWWELEQLPPQWLDRGRDVDEIWAPTSFIASAMRTLGKPVFPMLPSVRLPAFAPLPKPHFGLSPDKLTFLFVFDMNSRMPRKNPLGLIRAFRLAFRPSDPVELVIKVSPQEKYYPDWWAELRAAARDNWVSLIDRSLGRGELLALMNATDAYVSLHRSEGFGLTMAEAMLLGKPTIATGYSGNLDFMTPHNSYLVRHERATIADDVPPYPKGCTWAEPSVEHAAELMRRVFENPEEVRAVAARGQAEAASLLSPAAAGRRMAARLGEIGRS
jgi:glycosyltransferase involved in cell wall biosynthesis